MPRVIGIGGVFFKTSDMEGLKAWYRDVLGFEIENWGGTVFKAADMATQPGGVQVWGPFEAGSSYFAPSDKPFMINFMVDNLDSVVERLTAAGVPILQRMNDGHGKFAHILDPEGIKIELWEPGAAGG